MKAIRKSLIVMLLAVSMIITALPTTVFAEAVSNEDVTQTEIIETTEITENISGNEEILSENQTTPSEEDLGNISTDSLEEASHEEEAKTVEAKEETTYPALTFASESLSGTPLSGELGDYTISEDGNYYLSGDATGNITVADGKDVTLDLNGYVLSSLSGSVIKNGGTLEIKDSNSGNQTHNFKVGEDNLWTLTSETEGAVAYENLTDRPEAGTIVTVTGGCITGAAFSAIGGSNGGGIDNGEFLQSEDSVLTLSGGNIVGNMVTSTVENNSSAEGGGVLNSGTFTMNGGMIAGNLVCGSTGSDRDNLGGGVYNTGDFTMNDGVISFNTAVGDGVDTQGFGGGVNTKYGTFTMEGGLIGYNDAEYGGGIVSAADSKSTIRGGTISDNGAILGGGIYTVNSSTVIIQGGNFTNNTASYYGGAVFIHGPATITGGTYAGNTAEKGCGIYAAKDFTLGGSVTITGHTRTTGEKDNIYLAEGALITPCDYTGTCGVRKDDITGVISTETDKKYVSNFISDNKSFGIHFNADNKLEISPFTVTVNSSLGGSAAANLSSSKPGNMISISVTPDEGYGCAAVTVVRNDTGEAVPTYNDNSFTMPASDVTVTVTFVEFRTITKGRTENGYVMINGSSESPTTAMVGSEVALEAIADYGYRLKEYCVFKRGDEGTTVTVTDGKFTMPDYNVVVTAEFEKAYAVTIGEITGYGSVSADKTAAEQGETVTLTVTPKTDYDVSWVKVTGADGAEISVSAVQEGRCTFIMPAQNVTVTAAFEGWGDLQIGTSVVDATTKASDTYLTFTLKLTGEDGQAVTGEYTYTTSDGRSGKVQSGGSVTLKDGQTATIKDLPADIEYEVTETDVPGGFSVTAISGAKGVINAKQTAAASFTNTYTTTGSVQLEVTKTLAGRTLQDGQFSFQLLDNAGTEVLRTATCAVDGEVTFGAITYGNADNGKTYTYYIRENVPDDAKNAGGVTWKDATDVQKDAGGFSLKGYTYDSAKRKVEVTITDNGNGTMTATPAYYDASGTKADDVTIANEYSAAGEVSLNLWTTLKARELKADEFSFGLYEKDGTTPVTDAKGNAITAKNTADGTVEFPVLSYDETDIGKTYTYVVKEIVPEETDPEYDKTVVYDTTPWTFEVTVSDNGNSTLSFTQTVKDKDGKTGAVPVVKNTLKDGSLSITNILQNGDASQEFKYIVKFTSPTGDDLDGDYTFSRKEIASNEIIPTAAIPTASTFGDRSEAAFSVAALSEEQSENTASEEAEALIMPMGNIGSGTCGTCSWVIDASGCLTISAGTLASSTGASSWPWYSNRTEITSVVIEKGVIAGNSVQGMFQNHSALETADVSGLDTSNVENMSYMFSNCSKLASLDVSTFNTSKVTNIKFIFNNCTALTTLTLRTETNNTFVTTNVTIMQKMFYKCSSLISLDLSNLDTSKVVGNYGMSDVFTGATDLKSVTLGADFSFKSSDDKSSCKLPGASTTAPYTGKWKWNGTGKTVASLTAAELAEAYPNDTTAPAGTWVWEESTSYTVKFDANGGKGTMADMTCEPGTEYTLTANAFYLMGYTFKNWNTKADGTGTSYADGATIKDLGASTLYAQWEKEGPGKMTGGQMELTLHGNECLTISGVPAGTQYQVYEETPAGWVLVSQSGTSGVVETLKTAASSFTNKYEPTTAQAAILGYVTVDGSAGKVDSGSYSFQLKNSDSTVTETVACGDGGSIAFSPISYTAAGTYTYTVSQVIPSETGYIEYDNHTETVTVTVTDDGTGNLSANVTYDESGVAFDNKDNTPAPQGTLKITNTVKGTTAADKDFTFTVVTVSGGAATTQTKTAKAGETVEVGTFDAGTTYTITETGIPAGYTMTSQTDAKGTITDGTVSTATFTNTYAATGAATLQASKTLTGGTLTEGQFSFVLKEGDTTLQTSVCAADGTVTFQPVTFTAAGAHTYTIGEEVPEDAVNAKGVKWAEATAEEKAAGGFFKNNVEYDSHTENVTVEASDNGEGVITTMITYDTDGAAFTNTAIYSVTAAACTGGIVAADKVRAAKDDTITVTAAPAEGFKIDKVYYNDGTQHEISAVSGVYSFTMPAKAVTVSATFVHAHSWTYSLSEDNRTISATCAAPGCDYTGTDTSLTITAPKSLIYNGSSHDAAFGTVASFLGGSLPEITYEYKAAEEGTYASVSDTKAAGFYKASFTVGEGDGAKIAYVEYEVAKVQLTVTGTTADSKTYDGTTAANAHLGTVTGKVGEDKVDVEINTANFADRNAGNGKGVTVSYKLTGDDAGNYIAPANDLTSADISTRQLTVTGSAADGKTYDGNTTAVAHVGTVSGIVDDDDVAVTASATFDNKNAGNGKTVTIVYGMSGEDVGNYSVPVNDTTTADIEKKQLNIKADDKTSYVGSELEKLTYTADELISGDSFTGELSTDADKTVIGTYDIIQNTLEIDDGNNGQNYTINYAKGTYTVTDKEIQTLEFAGVTGGKVAKTYGDAAFTEAVSGVKTTVTYSSSDTSVATVDANTGKVTILKAGSTIIRADAEETAQYAAGSAQYTLTINRFKVDVPQAVTGLVYNGKDQLGVVLPDGALYTLTDNVKKDAGTYTATASLNDKENYEWNLDVPSSEDQNISWSIGRAQVTVTAEDKTMNLGEKVPEFTAKATGLIGSDKVTYSFNALNPEAQGIYSIVPAGDAVQGNYSVTYKQGYLTVSKKDGTASVNSSDVVKALEKYQAKEEYKGKTLDIEVRTDGTVPESAKTLISQKLASGKKAQYMETELFLIIKSDGGTTEKNIGNENDTLISVTYKFDFSSKQNIQVYRAYEKSDKSVTVEELTEKANADGEYISYNKEKGEITVVAKKYSTFAVAYNEVSVPGTGDSNSAWLYILIAALALGAIGVAAVRRKADR